MSEVRVAPFVVREGEGASTRFVGALMVMKATAADTGGAFDLLDQTVPGGYAAPRHIHRHEDEAWYLLEGEATFFCGAETFQAGRGSFVFLPRGVEHTFKVGPEGARLLTLTFPSGFAAFVEEAGEPDDPARLAEIAARYGIEITGPPPI
jgi:mannose-6-phosphate isomerase-like protein (cupin superfamily)